MAEGEEERCKGWKRQAGGRASTQKEDKIDGRGRGLGTRCCYESAAPDIPLLIASSKARQSDKPNFTAPSTHDALEQMLSKTPLSSLLLLLAPSPSSLLHPQSTILPSPSSSP